MDARERGALRRKRIVANVANDFAQAEAWDLDFWQNQTPEARLSALVAIRRDVQRVLEARGSAPRGAEGEEDWTP